MTRSYLLVGWLMVAASVEDGGWERLGPAGMASAAAGLVNGKLVVHGGRVGDAAHDQHWEWDGARWRERIGGPRPSARYEAASATFRGSLVLFGGLGPGGLFDDTWEYDGVDWIRRTSPSAPSARQGAAMAPVGNRLLLFGGVGAQGPLDDTWEWDGASWTLLAPAASPPPQAYHAMAAGGRGVVLYGGTETWEWDGETWLKAATVFPNPGPRTRHAMGTVGGRAILFGGYLVGFSTWAWEGTKWEPLPTSTAPAGLSRYNAAYTSDGEQLYLAFGWATHGGSSHGDIWRFDGDWARVEGATQPEGRFWHGCTTLGGKVLVAGGSDPQLLPFTLWEFDGDRWTERRSTLPDGGVGPTPAARQGATLITLAGKAYLFGGATTNHAGHMDDTWAWDGQSWEQLQPAAAPSPRFAHAMATLGDIAYLYGGTGPLGGGTETWSFDGASWMKLAPPVDPGGRNRLDMAAVGDRLMLYSGAFNQQGTWEFDGGTWERRFPATEPAPRAVYSMTSWGPDAAVLFGGEAFTGTRLDDLWKWDGTSWALLSEGGPGGRIAPCIAALGQDLIVFGGQTRAQAMTDTWRFRISRVIGSPCTQPAQCQTGNCVDGVCCDSPCGSGAAATCQSCNQPGFEGQCRPSGPGVCRAATGPCDLPESCDGEGLQCPADEVVPEGTQCGPGVCSAGACLVPDAGAPDAGTDGGHPADPDGGADAVDAGAVDKGAAARGGCGCGAQGGGTAWPAMLLLLGLALAGRRGRSSSRSRP